MNRPRLARPQPARVAVALVIVGLLAGLAVLVVPMEAALDDDPLLQFAAFSSSLSQVATDVDCGAPVGNLGRRASTLGLYDLALSDACREAATRRAATAVAAVSVIGILAMIGLAGDRRRDAVFA